MCADFEDKGVTLNVYMPQFFLLRLCNKIVNTALSQAATACYDVCLYCNSVQYSYYIVLSNMVGHIVHFTAF